MNMRHSFDIADPYRGADHVIGGTWGHHVSFIQPHHMLSNPATLRIPVWGHLPAHYPIHVGHCIIHEYEQHWVYFEVSDLEYMQEPPDMFFATLVVSKIWTKDGRLVWNRGIMSWVYSFMSSLFGRRKENWI